MQIQFVENKNVNSLIKVDSDDVPFGTLFRYENRVYLRGMDCCVGLGEDGTFNSNNLVPRRDSIVFRTNSVLEPDRSSAGFATWQIKRSDVLGMLKITA